MNAPVAPAQIRRFGTADLASHAKWLIPRLLQAYPHLSEHMVGGWLQTICDSNGYMFLHLPRAVGLAQVSAAHTLAPRPLVREMLVWVEDPADAALVEEAAAFYDEFARWGKAMGCDVLVVEEMTDVPHDLIKARLGRIFARQEQFARL